MNPHAISRALTYSLIFVMALVVTGCSSRDSSSPTGESEASAPAGRQISTGKSLVVYFSRTGENYWRGDRKILSQGNTAILAKEIAAQTEADTYEIIPADPYSDDYMDTVARNMQEEQQNARPAIANNIPDLSQYSTIYLGSPVWNSQMPMIMRTFVDQAQWSGQEVRPFVTHAMSGMAGIDQEYGRIIPQATVTDGLAVLGEDTPADPDSPDSSASDTAKQAVQQWLTRLGTPTPSTTNTTNNASSIDEITYRTTYQDTPYDKKAFVYLPAGYDPARRHPVLYLIHGSTGSAEDMANGLKEELDQLSTQADQADTAPLVVFATYYPDRSYVTPNYTRDAVLNEFFAQNELPNDLMPLVERSYAVYPADDPESPAYRGLGGFSMGAVTTWYGLRYHPELFNTYLPIAGDAWVPQGSSQSGRGNTEQGTALVDAIRRGRQTAGLDTQEMKILAGVGERDGTGAAMQPQVQALTQSGLFPSGNVDFYQAPDEGHSAGALRAVVRNYYGRIFE